MSTSRQDWGEAYARQSASDFEVYETLAGLPDVPACHKLHYLQMACEKIAKAYQWRDLAAKKRKLTTSHVAFFRFVMSYLASPAAQREYAGRDSRLAEFKRRSGNLAREIEKLAPAVDPEHSPSNAEYPWESGSSITVPCRYSYPNLASLDEPVGRNFLKLIKEAIVGFDSIAIR